jgi:hypothetical protein
MAKLIETPADTPFNRRMAEGHKNRTGHKLDAVQVSDDGVLWHTVRLCCGETVPETVDTWTD